MKFSSNIESGGDISGLVREPEAYDSKGGIKRFKVARVQSYA